MRRREFIAGLGGAAAWPIVTAAQSVKDSEASYSAAGGELIKLPPDEQAKMMKIISSVGPDVTKNDPELAAAYKFVADAAERTRQTPSQ